MRVNWGISAADIDDYDRDSQYRPYDGPMPTNGVYVWKLKKLVSVAGVNGKYPQLRMGLELHPRNKAEKAYEGYYLTNFAVVSPNAKFRYVPFLDAIGVTGREFENGTVADEEGNIKKIGKWRMTGATLIKGELKDNIGSDGITRKKIGWFGAFDPDSAVADDDEGDDEDDEYAGEYDDDDESAEVSDDDDW